MIIHYIQKKICEIVTKSERGVAVIVALGVFVLLFGLGVSFITTLITERKAARNVDALKMTRMVAQSGLQRTLTAVEMYAEDTSSNLNNIFSYNDDDNDATEMLGGDNGLMKTQVDAVTFYSLNENYDTNSNPTWQYIKSGDGENRIVARFAYVAIADHGRLDPSACLDSGYNSFTIYGRKSKSAASESNNRKSVGRDGVEVTSLGFDGIEIIGRPGRQVNEIFLRSMDHDREWLNKNKNYLDKISSYWSNPRGKLMVDKKNWEGRWLDFATLFSKKKLNVKANAEKILFKKYFVLDSPADPEAFWIDHNDDLVRETSEYYHRFNLMRSNWDDLSVDSLLSDPSTFNTVKTDNEIYSINWIRNWNNKGDYDTIDTARLQIAANLIDYNDSNIAATTDNADNPTYVGLDECPYINEVKLDFKGKIIEKGSSKNKEKGKKNTKSSTTYSCSLSIDKVSLELVNMYKTENINTVSELILSGEYQWTVKKGSQTYTKDETFSKTVADIGNINITSSGQAYSIAEISPSDADISSISENDIILSDGGGSTQTSIINLKINDLKIKLTDSGTGVLYDYAYVDSGSDYYTISDNGKEKTLYVDYQIGDPRQNLLVSDWGGVIAADDEDTGTIGSTNFIYTYNPNPGGDVDPEPNATNPWDISTAYIRNSAMMSPWELGFIHRGAKWKTINLKKYNSSVGMDGGGEKYVDGDANILDQIKMTSDKETSGKINLNSKLDQVLIALFQHIRVGSDIGSIEGPGTLDDKNGDPTAEVDEVVAEELANAVLLSNGTTDGSSYYTRSQILRHDDGVEKFTNNTLGLEQESDALQEEIIGKFINLTKAFNNTNIFNVIVVAQAIKDNGTAGKYETGIDLILATQKIIASIQRDPSTNKLRVIKYQFID
jgi:hypothetical protein